MCVSFQIMFSFGYMPRSGVAESYDSSIFNLLGNFILVSIVAVPLLNPPTVWEGSLLSTPSLTFVICRLFDDSHSDQCEMISHCGFDLYFSNN